MPKPPSPAQRAIRITFVLKGHLKNIQLSYLRAAALLALVRDEKLYAALKHDSLESYTAARLGLQRTALYRYLQIYDWVRESHPGWLAPKPKGFIPELSDAYALMWIERQLGRARLPQSERAELEALRRKALAGKLSEREFREHRNAGRTPPTATAALLTVLRSARRHASSKGVAPNLIAALDALIDQVQAALGRAAVGPRRASRRTAGIDRRRSAAARRQVH